MTNHALKKSRTILLVSMILGSLCLLCGVAVAGYYLFWIQPRATLANELRAWVPENSTPGTDLFVNETWRQTYEGMTKVYYQATADGLPPNTDFTLQVWDKIMLKETGELSLRSDVSGRLSLDQFCVSNFVRGELLVFALVSNDSKIRVFERVIPFPIETTGNGDCRVWVELLNTRGTAFAVHGEGFESNETLDYQQMGHHIQVDANGTFTSHMLPEILGKRSGTVRETFAGQTCEVTIEYEWGLAALEVQ